jgi:hypothetical protein
MTQDGVDGTAADCHRDAAPRGRTLWRQRIKPDDGRRAPRYIGPAYPHTQAGFPDGPRREWQVAAALRNDPDPVIVSPICGAADPARQAHGVWRRPKRMR